jgi:DNA modification methylase
MSSLQDKHFDMTITSPPYNMNLRINAKGDGYCSRQAVKGISTKYKNYSDNLPMQEYELFLKRFLAEALRVSGIVFLNIQQITGNKPAIARALGYFADELKEVIIWDKQRAQPSISDGVLNSRFEYIYVFGGNPIARQFKNAKFQRGTESNIWSIQTEASKNKEHRACYPVAIPKKIMRLFASEGDHVFDPFMGTGTTAIAAHYEQISFTGCEIDRSYYDEAKKRVELETAQLDMFQVGAL